MLLAVQLRDRGIKLLEKQSDRHVVLAAMLGKGHIELVRYDGGVSRTDLIPFAWGEESIGFQVSGLVLWQHTNSSQRSWITRIWTHSNWT